MIKLLLYVSILVLLFWIMNYFWVKSKESFRDLKKEYNDYKRAYKRLKEFLK
jgi:hypothetical protein